MLNYSPSFGGITFYWHMFFISLLFNFPCFILVWPLHKNIQLDYLGFFFSFWKFNFFIFIMVIGLFVFLSTILFYIFCLPCLKFFFFISPFQLIKFVTYLFIFLPFALLRADAVIGWDLWERWKGEWMLHLGRL